MIVVCLSLHPCLPRSSLYLPLQCALKLGYSHCCCRCCHHRHHRLLDCCFGGVDEATMLVDVNSARHIERMVPIVFDSDD
jgi:hypothetical protein